MGAPEWLPLDSVPPGVLVMDEQGRRWLTLEAGRMKDEGGAGDVGVPVVALGTGRPASLDGRTPVRVVLKIAGDPVAGAGEGAGS